MSIPQDIYKLCFFNKLSNYIYWRTPFLCKHNRLRTIKYSYFRILLLIIIKNYILPPMHTCVWTNVWYTNRHLLYERVLNLIEANYFISNTCKITNYFVYITTKLHALKSVWNCIQQLVANKKNISTRNMVILLLVFYLFCNFMFI